jgi:AcrR family transcriptional regulator
MKKSIKPRKMPQQARSKQTREEILLATAHLLNQKPLGDVSTNHIAKKTGISIGTLYKYYPNKDSVLADLSLMYMQRDAELFGRIFETHAGQDKVEEHLISELVESLMELHKVDAQVRGVVYQNLERLKLVSSAHNATRKIQEKGVSSHPELDPILTWVSISAVNAAVHSMSQLTAQRQQWEFVRTLCRGILSQLLQKGRVE